VNPSFVYLFTKYHDRRRSSILFLGLQALFLVTISTVSNTVGLQYCVPTRTVRAHNLVAVIYTVVVYVTDKWVRNANDVVSALESLFNLTGSSYTDMFVRCLQCFDSVVALIVGLLFIVRRKLYIFHKQSFYTSKVKSSRCKARFMDPIGWSKTFLHVTYRYRMTLVPPPRTIIIDEAFDSNSFISTLSSKSAIAIVKVSTFHNTSNTTVHCEYVWIYHKVQ